MALRKFGARQIARSAIDESLPCAFCNRNVDDELLNGKRYAIGGIQCHYYCVLLSSCLMQRGRDEDGIFGFLFDDIRKEIERCKKHKCSYCGKIGASLGCSVTRCRKQFHLPCGKERNSVSLFHGNFKSFCEKHAPKQNIPAAIMAKANLRKSKDNKAKKRECRSKDLKEVSSTDKPSDSDADTPSVCVICYEHIEGYPTPNTFWPPCCGGDAWFHRTCLQRMALSAGMHYLKCPLCNDKKGFYKAVLSQGFFVPDRDAAWEMVQNAFAEVYERSIRCTAVHCHSPTGRGHDAVFGLWSITTCLMCGSSGMHGGCLAQESSSKFHICAVCKPAAPENPEIFADSIQAVMAQEEERIRRAQGGRRVSRVARMSAGGPRRWGKLLMNNSSSSRAASQAKTESQPSNTTSSRNDLNLKPPKKCTTDEAPTTSLKLTFSPAKVEKTETTAPSESMNSTSDSSPSKILQQECEKRFCISEASYVKKQLLDEVRKRFEKPQPLSVKRKIVIDIVDKFYYNLLPEIHRRFLSKKRVEIDEDVIEVPVPPKEIIDTTEIPDVSIPEQQTAEPPISNTPPLPDPPIFTTPKKLKTIDTLTDSSLEISAKDEIVNIDVFKLENVQNDEILKPQDPSTSTKYGFKFSPCNKEGLEGDVDIDEESFKDKYLDEVSVSKMDTEVSSRKRKADKTVVELESKKRKKKKKRRSISIKNKNIQVKIKWRKEQLKLQFNDVIKHKTKKKSKKFKQYVLNYSPDKNTIRNKRDMGNSKPVLGKPDVDVTPMKRKYKKQEKTPDNLVQTSIQKFFKVTSPDQDDKNVCNKSDNLN